MIPLLILLTAFQYHAQDVSARCHTSISGVTLTGHAFSSFPDSNFSHCLLRCKAEFLCQSLTFFISTKMCQLHNRTISARPGNSERDVNAVYFENPNRAGLGSSDKIPAGSCKEIKMSGGVSSARYWLDQTQSGNTSTAFCNMTTEEVEECKGSPCQHGGTCTYYGSGTYRCACIPGLTGANCEININECSSNPCRNGGTCTDQVNGYRCTCQPGYGGSQCQANINECSSNPCINGGSCFDEHNRYTCNCLPYYYGSRCQSYNSDPCVSYTTLSDSDRRMDYVSTIIKCDRSGKFIKKWYRFMGNAGNRMSRTCIPTHRCNAHAPGWLNGAHPTTHGQIVTRTV